MNSELLDGGRRRFAMVCDKGEEAVAALEAFASEHGLDAGHFTGNGAFSYVVLGFFDGHTQDYRRIHIDQPREVLSLVGDIVARDGRPKVNAHIVVARADGAAYSGHLLEGYVRPRLELTLEAGVEAMPARNAQHAPLALANA